MPSTSRARKTQLDIATAVLALAKTEPERNCALTYANEMQRAHFNYTNLGDLRGAKIITTLL